MDQLDSVVDEGRNDSASGPGSRNRTYEEQDEYGGRDIRHILPDCRFKLFPGGLEHPHRQGDADGAGKEQRHLARTENGITPVDADVHGEYRHEYQNRDQGHP